MEKVLLRLCAYASYFSFRENKMNKTPSSWFPLPWEQDDTECEQISEEDCQDLMDEMKRWNEYFQKKNEPKPE